MLNSSSEVQAWEPQPAERAASPVEMLFKACRVARRQIVLLLLMSVVGAALGYLYVRITPPSYTADASVLVDTRRVQLFSQPPVLDDILFDSAAIETQLEILRSDRTLLPVIEKLRMWDDPDYADPASGLVGRLRRLVAGVFPWIPAGDTPVQQVSASELRENILTALQSRLEVYRVGGSFVIAIRYKSSDAERAAAVADAVADAYVTGLREARYAASSDAAGWLQERLRQLKSDSIAADQALLDFKAKNNIVTTKGQLLDDQEITDLNSQLVAARERTSEARAKLDRIEAVIAANAADPTTGATVADALNNAVISKLRSQYLDLSSRLTDWTSRFGANHLAVVDLRRQMLELRNATLNEMKRVAETYKSDFEIAKQRQDSVQGRLDQAVVGLHTANQAQAKARELESAAQTYHSLLDNYQQRYTETAQQQMLPFSSASILARASIPTAKTQPKSKLIMALALGMGLLAGCGIGVLREVLDGTYRTAAQVERSLQTDCVVLLPRSKAPRASKADHFSFFPLLDPPRTIRRRPDIIWAGVEMPRSRFADSLRSLKSVVDLSVSSSTKIIGLTSALPGEGKSSTAAALAIMIADIGAKAILVDCDLRNPSLSRKLAPKAEFGLLDVVSQERTLADTVWKDPETGLAFLPGCAGSAPLHTSECLATNATRALFERLRSHYDYIIVDLPPLAPLVDVRSTASLIDGYLMVVEWGGSKISIVERAFDSAPGVQDNLIGAVLTKTDLRGLKRYEGSSSSLYWNKDFARYGEPRAREAGLAIPSKADAWARRPALAALGDDTAQGGAARPSRVEG